MKNYTQHYVKQEMMEGVSGSFGWDNDMSRVTKHKVELIDEMEALRKEYKKWGLLFNHFKLKTLRDKLNNHQMNFPEFYL